MRKFLDNEIERGQFPSDFVQELTRLILDTYSDIEFCEYEPIDCETIDVQFHDEGVRRAYEITVKMVEADNWEE